MKTEKEVLDELDKDFNLDFEEIAKKSRFKRRRWTVIAAILVTAAIVLIVVLVDGALMRHANKNATEVASINNMITNPNLNVKDTKTINRQSGLLNGSFTQTVYKDVDGYAVQWVSQTYRYGLFSGASKDDAASVAAPSLNTRLTGGEPSSYFAGGTNQKIAMFFTPNFDASNPLFKGVVNSHNVKEAETLAKLPNSLAEVAVTFDRPYSYAEIRKMIPSNLLVNWYWLGINSSKMQAGATTSYIGLGGGHTQKQVNGAIKVQSNYNLTEAGYKKFVAAAKKAPSYAYFNQQTVKFQAGGKSLTWNPFDDGAKQVAKYPNLSEAKFSGVILSGQTENLIGLNQKPWVYATNVGATSPIIPFVKPLK